MLIFIYRLEVSDARASAQESLEDKISYDITT